MTMGKRLADNIVQQVMQLRGGAVTVREIARQCEISIGSVCHIVNGRHRSEVPASAEVEEAPLPAVDPQYGLRPTLLSSERWAERGERCEDCGGRLLVRPCRICKVTKHIVARGMARRLGLLVDDALIEQALAHVDPQCREQVECLISEYRLVIWRIGEPGPMERKSVLLRAHDRLRSLLSAVATGEWSGADPGDFDA